MNILQELTKVDSSSIMVLENARLNIGESDKDAAKILINLFNDFSATKLTYSEVHAKLLEMWMEAILDDKALDSKQARALWDALFWFRFLAALER